MRLRAMVLVVAGLWAAQALAGDKPVVHYDFSEAAGGVLHDRSGNGNDATIHGATWTKSGGQKPALAFDGVDDYVDCGAGKSTDITDRISVEVWACPEKSPPAGEAGIVGKSFESYLVTHYAEGCWSYISGGGNNCKTPFSLKRWHHIVETFDGGSIKLYMDGVLADGHASKARTIGLGKRLMMGASDGAVQFTKNAHFCGLIGEVRIYNRALSAEEVLSQYRTTRLTRTTELSSSISLFSREVTVTLGLRGLGELPPNAAVEVALCDKGNSSPLQKTRLENLPSWETVELTLAPASLSPGEYELRAKVVDAQGKQVGSETVAPLTWPAAPTWPGLKSGKVLNNFVTELLNVSGGPQDEYAFFNPRDGWVFISSTMDLKDADKASVMLGDAVVIAHEKGKPQTLEAMRRLPQGEHKIAVRREGAPVLKSLIVRAVPELIYCKLPLNPHIKEYGPYDWEFLQRHVLPHANTMVIAWSEKIQPCLEEWKQRGGRLIVECPLPGLSSKKGETITANEVEQKWASNPGLQNPQLDGIIIDEFSSGLPADHFAAWTEAIRRLHANPKFKDRAFYPYCGPLHGTAASERFAQAVLDAGGKFALERYLPEQRTEAGARAYLNQTLTETVRAWRGRMPGIRGMPGIERSLIFCFGYLCAPPESLNMDPGVNWLTYMDMQVHHAANSPTCFGVYGMMFYTASYADEESIRLAGRLYRHYGIEGQADRLIKDPYLLTHIQNPDFEQGLDGWTVSPAEPQSIAVKRMDGYSYLQGRYPKTSKGDVFLWMRRSAKGPNSVSQRILNLTPGRLYSLKMYTADYQELLQGRSVEQRHGVSIEIENADLIREKCFQSVFPNCYSHTLGAFDGKNRAWLNFYTKVFRAKAAEAALLISDWAGPAPGGPVGQETIFNFIEVQPYYE